MDQQLGQKNIGFTCFRLRKGKCLSLIMHGERLGESFASAGRSLKQKDKDQLNQLLQTKLTNLAAHSTQKIKITAHVNPLDLEVEAEPIDSLPKPVSALVLEEQEQWPSNNRIKNFNYSRRRLELEKNPGVDEILYADREGRLLDSSFSSIFAVMDNKIIYSASDAQQVLGICRRRILQVADKVFTDLIEKPLLVSELGSYDYLFLSNEVRLLRPIQQISVENQQIKFALNDFQEPLDKLSSLLIKEEDYLCQMKLF